MCIGLFVCAELIEALWFSVNAPFDIDQDRLRPFDRLKDQGERLSES
jgi:hypothetical protein